MLLRLRVWSAGRLLLLAGALLATFFIFAVIAMRVAVRAREVTVPDLIGRPLSEATAMATELDLAIRVAQDRRPDPRMPAGHVIEQEPAAGSGARRQRGIRVWVSAGAQVAVAPDLLGESERGAQVLLTQQGLSLGSVAEIRSARFPSDVVVAQDPPPGTETSEVRVLVNRGEDRATYVMPDLIGMGGDRAADVMRARGFRVAIVARAASPGVPPGIVVRQSPQGGYQVQPGDAISLEVSR